jgi:hypothetical protein
MEQGNSSRTSQASVSAALAAANAALRDGALGVRFPGEDGGQSLAEMAQRDLDAALQLLTDRAQYITGSSGAAIALRRNGKNDMMCRASTGSNAPELGVLLSTEFGLSGESVRTRRALRCDDAERDARVNHEVCRELGIASVVVMPVVHDDEVLGVFELFSGKPMAFGERDVSALQRLSEMVETAVTLARTAVVSERPMETSEVSAVEGAAVEFSEAEIFAGQNLPTQTLPTQIVATPILATQTLATQTLATQNVDGPHPVEHRVVEDPIVEHPIEDPVVAVEAEIAAAGTASAKKPQEDQGREPARTMETLAWPTAAPNTLTPTTSAQSASAQSASAAAASAAAAATVRPDAANAPAAPSAALRSAVLRPDLQPSHPSSENNVARSNSASASPASASPAPAILTPTSPASANHASANQTPANSVPANPAPATKPLLWSSALNGSDAQKPDADRSHVPPAFRNLSQCQACGFPISAGRVLCIDCEEKKWRGQLKMPPVTAVRAGSGAAAAAAPAPAPTPAPAQAGSAPTLRPTLPLATQASPAKSKAITTDLPAPASSVPISIVPTSTVQSSSVQTSIGQSSIAHTSTVQVPAPARQAAKTPLLTPVFTGGLEPSQSWLARNKYIVGALLLVAAGLAAVVFLR